MKKRHVGILMGGTNAEREVSLRTGEGVVAALSGAGHVVTPLVWRAAGPGPDELVRSSGVDVVFLALHGRGGEDGCVQGLLELMGVPYTGSGVLASALAMDKVKAKEMFRLHNVPTPAYYVAREADLDDLASVHGSLGFPVIVKPRREGSSVGLTKVGDAGKLAGAIERCLAFGDDVLVERFGRGTEICVGILDGRALGAIEVIPKEGLYDYDAKYTPGKTDYVCPPSLAAGRLRGVVNLALRAVGALGCTGACRVDLIVSEGENECVLEVNTLPGMTPTSLLPKIAAAAGIDYAALCEAILEQATLEGGDGGLRQRPRQEAARAHHGLRPGDAPGLHDRVLVG